MEAAAAPARRAALAERLDAVERVYASIFATHEQAAEVLTDVFEQRWARDRIPSDRTRMDSLVPPARAAVDGAGVADLDRVERRVVTAGPAASQRVHRRTSAQPEMSVPNVCSVQLPNVCSFRLPLTHPRYRLHDLPVLPRTLPLLAVT